MPFLSPVSLLNLPHGLRGHIPQGHLPCQRVWICLPFIGDLRRPQRRLRLRPERHLAQEQYQLPIGLSAHLKELDLGSTKLTTVPGCLSSFQGLQRLVLPNTIETVANDSFTGMKSVDFCCYH